MPALTAMISSSETSCQPRMLRQPCKRSRGSWNTT
jgi:hypothetical protein